MTADPQAPGGGEALDYSCTDQIAVCRCGSFPTLSGDGARPDDGYRSLWCQSCLEHVTGHKPSASEAIRCWNEQREAEHAAIALEAHLEANPHLDPCAPSPGAAEVVGMTKALVLLHGTLSRRFEPSKEYGLDYDRGRLAACNRITALLPQIITLIEGQAGEIAGLKALADERAERMGDLFHRLSAAEARLSALSVTTPPDQGDEIERIADVIFGKLRGMMADGIIRGMANEIATAVSAALSPGLGGEGGRLRKSSAPGGEVEAPGEVGNVVARLKGHRAYHLAQSLGQGYSPLSTANGHTGLVRDLDEAIALIIGLGKKVSSLTRLLDKQLGTPCEQIRSRDDTNSPTEPEQASEQGGF